MIVFVILIFLLLDDDSFLDFFSLPVLGVFFLLEDDRPDLTGVRVLDDGVLGDAW
jgi:hypothetical protein